MKIPAVVVIEITAGIVQQAVVFPETSKGNKDAEELFTKLCKENGDAYVEVSLDDGIFCDESGYECIIIHSTGDLALGKQYQPDKDTLPDWIGSLWHITDVQNEAPDFTDDQAREVLERARVNHDPEAGICWDTLRDIIDEVRGEALDESANNGS